MAATPPGPWAGPVFLPARLVVQHHDENAESSYRDNSTTDVTTDTARLVPADVHIPGPLRDLINTYRTGRPLKASRQYNYQIQRHIGRALRHMVMSIARACVQADCSVSPVRHKDVDVKRVFIYRVAVALMSGRD